MLYAPVTDWSSEMRLLGIHQGETGWYFTIHRDKNLLFQSPEEGDRTNVTYLGIQYLNELLRIDHEFRNQQKGRPSGQ